MSAKQALVEILQSRIARDLAALMDSQRSTQAGAVHEESRPEDDKDTRAIESSYLARGLAERVAHLQHAAALLAGFRPQKFGVDDPVAVGALVALESSAGETRRYFVVPAAGGLELEHDGRRITSVTPTAPIGAALIGLQLGEDVEVVTPQGSRSFTLIALE